MLPRILRETPMNRFSRLVRFLQLARVPALILVCLGAFGPIAFYSSLRKTLLGTLDLGESAWGVFWVSFGVFAVQATAVASLNLIDLYGPDRFKDFDTPKRSMGDLTWNR